MLFLSAFSFSQNQNGKKLAANLTFFLDEEFDGLAALFNCKPFFLSVLKIRKEQQKDTLSFLNDATPIWGTSYIKTILLVQCEARWLEADMGAACAQGARRVGVDFEILISFTVFRSLEDHFELYNLDIDPGETNDLAKSKTKVK